MKKSLLLSIVFALVILMGSVPAWAAAAKDNQLVWVGDYEQKAWLGVNLSTIDGKQNTTKRLYKGQATSLAVVGDWIYFLKQDPDADVIVGNITKIKKDGTHLTEITKGNTVGQFSIEGQSIYYTAYDADYNLNLKVMKLDGTGSKLLAGKLPFWSYTLGKGLVFYVDTAGDSLLHRMKLDGTSKAAVSAGAVEPRGGYKLFGDTLYYSESAADTTKWYLVDGNGKNKVALTSKASIEPVTYTNQWFYFIEVTTKNGVQSQTLMKVKRDGTLKKAVAQLGAKDQLIGVLSDSFVIKTSTDKLYQIGLDGKVTKPTK